MLISLALGLLTYFLTSALHAPKVQGLLGWDAFAISYVIIVLGSMNSARALTRLRELAAGEDENHWMIPFLLSIASLLGLVAIATLFTNTKALSDSALHLHLALAAATIVSSWSFIHTLFAVHYAHEYFGDADVRPDSFLLRGGLDFPKTEEPIFSDFLYYSYIIGMTCQVSDVQVCNSRMRRLTLAHGILAFFFNTIILALSVNFAASMIS